MVRAFGAENESRLDDVTIVIAGLGGGGSHVAQQAAHVGVGGFILIDDDVINETNLNRLVGGTYADVENKMRKVDIAARMIRAVNPTARITPIARKWQNALDEIRHGDVVFGCLDSVTAKDQLEDLSRRLLMPYIDQGMDVHEAGPGFIVAGQVVLSVPGAPCLRCLGIVTDEALEIEGRNYGAAGGKPQVVWPNGVLASTAVGLFMQLLLPWNSPVTMGQCLEYDGNTHTIHPSDRMRILRSRPCPHRSVSDLGDPTFDIRRRK
ncbi:ThiF family adenylyltransferase [Nostoc sp. CHAB 5834]|nr:ThiF family adenylyltransferase [Nostoc sp. CHAB 5834]